MKFTHSKDPLTIEQITSFERELGLQFPQSLRAHFLRANGGRPDLCIYDDEADSNVGVVVSECLPIRHEGESAIIVYKDQVLSKALLPKHFFPFAVDPGGDYLYVDCSSESGMVYLYLHDTVGEPLVPFKVGLDEFWSRLKPDE
jgi:cell wall assembly regulator SMI1